MNSNCVVSGLEVRILSGETCDFLPKSAQLFQNVQLPAW